jgi:transcriptional regulator with XRE-family HTH domain
VTVKNPVDVAGSGGEGTGRAPAIDRQIALMGQRIRRLRKDKGLTLVQLAGATDLSHSFLSQLERGLARPSMSSLDRIAHALDSSQIELMLAAEVRGPSSAEKGNVHVVRADEGMRGPTRQGEARTLARGNQGVMTLEWQDSSADPGRFYVHDEDEFLFIISGSVLVDLDDRGCELLHAGDSIHYPGGTRHRWSSPDGSVYRAIVVKEDQSLTGRTDDVHLERVDAARGGKS